MGSLINMKKKRNLPKELQPSALCGDRLKRLARYFTEPYMAAKGIETWQCWRFWIILACYTASFICIAYDPFFQVQYSFRLKSLLPLLLAYTLVSSLNWEMLWTGNPHGANLFLQWCIIPPVGLLFTRVFLAHPQTAGGDSFLGSLFRTLIATVVELADIIAEKLPLWLRDIFAHPWLAMLFLILLVVLSCRNQRFKVSAIFFFLVVSLIGMISAGGNQIFFFCSLFLLGGGLYLQWNPYKKLIFLRNVVERMEACQAEDRLLYTTILDIMKKMYENGQIDSRQLLRIVAVNYDRKGEYGEAQLKLISGEISRRMVEDFELATVSMTSSSVLLKPIPKLFHANEILAGLTVFPRLAAIVIVAFLWIIMPFDAIPDFIPFIGVLDDLAVNAMVMVIGRNSLKSLSQSNPQNI